MEDLQKSSVIIEEESKLNSEDQARRYCFTINNPFFEELEEVDEDLPVVDNKYNLSIITAEENIDYFIFKKVKVQKKLNEFESEEYVIERPFFKNIESMKSYIENLESFKYCIFQYERGANGTLHVQGYITFKGGKRFRTIKSFFPTAHIEKAKGTGVENREYCTKIDTRISGPYEIGEFTEERSRTDIKGFHQMLKMGATNNELMELYPRLYNQNVTKLDKMRSDLYSDYSIKWRNLRVTYVYGPAGTGKSRYVRKLLKDKKYFTLSSYDYPFTNYKFEKCLVMDEFAGQLSWTILNSLLDIYPYQLRGMGVMYPNCIEEIYIISNFKWNELYKSLFEEKPELKKTFYRRLHTIIEIPEINKKRLRKETIWVDNEDEYELSMGYTQVISKTIDYDIYGNAKISFEHPTE